MLLHACAQRSPSRPLLSPCAYCGSTHAAPMHADTRIPSRCLRFPPPQMGRRHGTPPHTPPHMPVTPARPICSSACAPYDPIGHPARRAPPPRGRPGCASNAQRLVQPAPSAFSPLPMPSCEFEPVTWGSHIGQNTDTASHRGGAKGQQSRHSHGRAGQAWGCGAAAPSHGGLRCVIVRGSRRSRWRRLAAAGASQQQPVLSAHCGGHILDEARTLESLAAQPAQARRINQPLAALPHRDLAVPRQRPLRPPLLPAAPPPLPLPLPLLLLLLVHGVGHWRRRRRLGRLFTPPFARAARPRVAASTGTLCCQLFAAALAFRRRRLLLPIAARKASWQLMPTQRPAYEMGAGAEAAAAGW